MRNKVEEFKSLRFEEFKGLSAQSASLKPLNSSTFEPLKDGWKWVRLGEVCEIIKGKKPELYEKRDSNDMIPYLTAEVIRFGVKPYRCRISDKNSVMVLENEIIIIADGSNSGEVFTGYRGALASTMGKLKLLEVKILKDYLYFFIRTYFERLNRPKRGSAIPHLEKDTFYNLLIPLPPLLEQRRIASKLQELMQEVERARTACEKQLEAVRALPSAYLREVFESEEAKKWERKKLGEVLEEALPGFACGKRAGLEGYIQLRMNNISSDGKIVLSSLLRVPATEKQVEKYRLKPGDVLFNNIIQIALNWLGKQLYLMKKMEFFSTATT